MQNGATRVDDRRVTTGSSGGGELGLLCAELHGLHALPVAPNSTGTRKPFLQLKNVDESVSVNSLQQRHPLAFFVTVMYAAAPSQIRFVKVPQLSASV